MDGQVKSQLSVSWARKLPLFQFLRALNAEDVQFNSKCKVSVLGLSDEATLEVRTYYKVA